MIQEEIEKVVNSFNKGHKIIYKTRGENEQLILSISKRRGEYEVNGEGISTTALKDIPFNEIVVAKVIKI